MKDVYRRFNLLRRSRPVREMLLGPVTEWQPMGASLITCLPGQSLGLPGFRFPMTFDDESAAKRFELELLGLRPYDCVTHAQPFFHIGQPPIIQPAENAPNYSL